MLYSDASNVVWTRAESCLDEDIIMRIENVCRGTNLVRSLDTALQQADSEQMERREEPLDW